jgi:8-oxo-dGTP pyrophosphatase MutT (NUDIX family)
MVGGHVEPGEDFDTAVHREILEETGIVTGPDDLVLWLETEFDYTDGHHSDYRVYAGRVDLTDDDIVLGEGRAIVFVDPAETAALDKAESCAHLLPLFLASDLYARLRSEGTTAPASRLGRPAATIREQPPDGSPRAPHGPAGPAQAR